MTVQDHVQAEYCVRLKVDFGRCIAKHRQVLAKHCQSQHHQSPNQTSSSLAKHHLLNSNDILPSVYRGCTRRLSQPTPLLHQAVNPPSVLTEGALRYSILWSLYYPTIFVLFYDLCIILQSSSSSLILSIYGPSILGFSFMQLSDEHSKHLTGLAYLTILIISGKCHSWMQFTTTMVIQETISLLSLPVPPRPLLTVSFRGPHLPQPMIHEGIWRCLTLAFDPLWIFSGWILNSHIWHSFPAKTLFAACWYRCMYILCT